MAVAERSLPVRNVLPSTRAMRASALPGVEREPAERPAPGTRTRLQSSALHRAIVQCAVAGAGLCMLVGGAQLGGHIMLANEGHKSRETKNHLAERMDESRYWQNRRAHELTPEAIGQKAAAIHMIRPDDRDTIVVR
jgi:hypothetical protein